MPHGLTIDNEGNLVSVKDVSTFDNKLGEDVSVADIRKELFEDENVVIDKNTDHGLSELTVNKESANEGDLTVESATDE